MYDLYEQGLKNKVDLHLISKAEAKKIDPMVTGYAGATEFIWSPTTSVVDSKSVVRHLGIKLEKENSNI